MRIAFGIFIILLGIIILFFNPGWNLIERIFENLSMVWPMILIFIGIGILSKIKGFGWLRFINIILMVLFILYLLLWPNFLDFGGLNLYKSAIDVPIDAVDGSTIKLIFITGPLKLYLEDEKNQRNITGFYSFNSKYFEILTKKNEVVFRSHKNYSFGKQNRIDLKLPKDYIYDVVIKSGVLSCELDFKENIIKNFDVDSGVINLDFELEKLLLPLNLKLKASIINADIKLPKGAKYDLFTTGGIKKVSVSNLTRDSVSPDFKMTVDSGIINLKLKGK